MNYQTLLIFGSSLAVASGALIHAKLSGKDWYQSFNAFTAAGIKVAGLQLLVFSLVMFLLFCMKACQ